MWVLITTYIAAIVHMFVRGIRAAVYGRAVPAQQFSFGFNQMDYGGSQCHWLFFGGILLTENTQVLFYHIFKRERRLK